MLSDCFFSASDQKPAFENPFDCRPSDEVFSAELHGVSRLFVKDGDGRDGAADGQVRSAFSGRLFCGKYINKRLDNG